MISIVICSIDSEKFVAVSANYATLFAGEPYEIIATHDTKSLAEGYNRGFARSTGEIMVFSHDDIEILAPDFVRKLRNYLNVYDIVGVEGTSCLIDAKWLAASLVVKNRQEVLGACAPEALHEASRRLV
jgi:hypothetical protein